MMLLLLKTLTSVIVMFIKILTKKIDIWSKPLSLLSKAVICCVVYLEFCSLLHCKLLSYYRCCKNVLTYAVYNIIHFMINSKE